MSSGCVVNSIDDDYEWGTLLLRQHSGETQYVIPCFVGCYEVIPNRNAQLKQTPS